MYKICVPYKFLLIYKLNDLQIMCVIVKYFYIINIYLFIRIDSL